MQFFFRRFLELTTAIVWKAQVIVPSGMRITFLLSKQILCLTSIYFKLIFGHLMSSLLVKIFRHEKTNQPTNRKIRPAPPSHDPQTAHQSGSTQTSESCFGIPCATYSPRCPIFLCWVLVSVSFSLLRSKKPKKTKEIVSSEPPKKGPLFWFYSGALWFSGLCELGMLCGGNMVWVESTWNETFPLSRVVAPTRHNSPDPCHFLELGNPFQTMKLGKENTPVFHVELNIQPPVIYAGIFLEFSHVVQQLTTATQKTPLYFPQSFPAKHTKTWKKNRTFRLWSLLTFRLGHWNLLEVPVEMVLGANHHLRTKERNRLHRLGATKTQLILWKFK